MSFAEGFVTGFANKLSEGIDERKKIARDYFQKQYEIATTVGLENHRKVKQQVDVSVKTAKQLQQMGVPKEIIMAVAAQDPMGLADFYGDVTKAQAAGIKLDQAFFDDFVTVSEGFKAPDEDFYTFFKKALSPIQSVAESDPEGFNRDRKGGIFAAMMGADPYGRARQKLDETIVIDGMSASDLARLGENYSPAGVEGAPTVTYNYDKVEERKDSEKNNDLSISEINSIDKTIEDRAQQIYDDARISGDNTMTREQARKQAAQEARTTYASVGPAVEYIDKTYGTTEITSEVLEPATDAPAQGEGEAPPEEAPAAPTGEPTEAVPGEEAATPAPEGTGAVAPAPEAVEGVSNDPIDPQQENLSMITIKGLVLTWYSNNSDGTVTYVAPNGEEYIFDPAEVRTFVQQFGTNFEG